MCIVDILLIGLVLLTLLAFGMNIARNNEKKEYNDGICPKCGGKFELFDYDSQDGRGYHCSKCETYPDYYDNEIIAAALGQVAKEYGYKED